MIDNLPSYVLEGIAGLIEKAGHDPVAIANSVGINPAALFQSDILINEVKFNDLFEEAARVCGDRFFGLKIAQIKSLDTLGPLWLLVRNASSVGDFLSLVSENMAIHTQGLIFSVIDQGESGASLVVEVPRFELGALQTAPRNTSITQVIEFSLAVVCNDARRSLGAKWVPNYVQFRHGPPSDKKPLRKVFGEHLFFNQDVNALHLSRSDVQAPYYLNPLNRVSTEAHQITARDLESRVGLGTSFVQQVNRILRLLINDQGATVGGVAKALNIPVRTLQYRLKKHNTSYQELYDKAREELARHYLASSELPIGAIAERLHFTDTAALSKFFKNRVGFSPREYAKKKCKLD
jgi:AraC-like DNA-binding protein